jgi:DNA (cytosine-5)-methyltransferase 1
MMGLPAGHVTDLAIGISRAHQLKAIGNGVCPQQAVAAYASLVAS